MSGDPTVLLRVPTELRDELKAPLGPIYEELASWYPDLDVPVVAVGDVVSYDCEQAGRPPDVAVVDGRTKRTAVDPDIESALAAPGRSRLAAINPAGAITRSLLNTLAEAIGRDEPVQVVVEGEEDLATLPAILLVPDGAHVLYGQPDEGVVRVTVDDAVRERVRELTAAMDGDIDAFRAMLGH